MVRVFMFRHSVIRRCHLFINRRSLKTMAQSEDAKMTSNCEGIAQGREGSAIFQLNENKVFYNPVQEFNRDLSIAVLRTFLRYEKPESDEVTILEALSASGLRSMRYAKEIPGINTIIANDISTSAVKHIEENIKLNQVEHIVKAHNEDATMLMYKSRGKNERFTAIDLDPYGCPAIFLDGAVQSVKDGGLLLVTATDMAILAGNSPETCFVKYGAVSLKSKACHENALRILLKCIESHANRYGRYIEPLLSVSADFYIRVFVRIFSGQIHCKKSSSKLSMLYQCVGCESFALQPLGEVIANPSKNVVKTSLPFGPPVSTNCEHCDHRFHMGGPIWSAPIHNISFVENILSLLQSEPEAFSTSRRMEGMLSMIHEELNDVPLYYSMEKLASVLHVACCPILKMRSAILNGGYKVSYSHACKASIKTDAPAYFIWDILRTWEKSNPVKESRLVEGSAAKAILSKPIKSKIDLSVHPDANPDSRKRGVLRFQFNPTPFWGPGTRSMARVGKDKMSKSIKNQNKKANKTNGNLKREHSPEFPIDDKKCLKIEDNSIVEREK